MKTEFKTLFRLNVLHEYYQNICKAVEFLPDEKTTSIFKRGNILLRLREGVLHLLYESLSGAPTTKLNDGTKIIFGLRSSDIEFHQSTNLGIAGRNNQILLFRNTPIVDILTADDAVICTSKLSYRIQNLTRPVELKLKDLAGSELHSVILPAAAAGVEADVSVVYNFDLQPYGEGIYQVEELGGSPSTTFIYYNNYLCRESVFAVVEINMDSSFYTVTGDITIPLPVQEDIWKYYVVGTEFTDPELASLKIKDIGFGLPDDGRTEIVFNQVAISPADTQAEMIYHDPTKVVLFKSAVPVKRRERTRIKIQLKKSAIAANAIIENLPNPQSKSSKTEIIILLTKP